MAAIVTTEKFSLKVNPTFKALVAIPVAGGKATNVEFTFKHRARKDFREFMDNLVGGDDVDILMDVASGWDLDEPFDKVTVTQMIEMYMGAGQAIIDTYIVEMTGARRKN